MNAACGARYPRSIDGVPILIDEASSVFTAAGILQQHGFFGRTRPHSSLIDRILPALSRDAVSHLNYGRLRSMLLQRNHSPRVLVIGAGNAPDGITELADARIEVVETDVGQGPRVQIVCDGHSLHFEDGSFDAVVAHAVLEHVIDPRRVVAEIHRVLAAGGFVYADTPFMQQVHGGAYDFHRFTHLGTLLLFRDFREISSGVSAGPGTALAWAYDYFLSAFVPSWGLRRFVRAFARLTAFPLKYLDALLVDKPGALDAASSIYFLGERSDTARSDREIVAAYRGTNPPPAR